MPSARPARRAQARTAPDAGATAPADGLAAVRERLLAWYRAYRRDLPWRRTKDPWAILVSEVMLQQTTVAAVKPYYQRFLKRWPRPVDLAEATRDQVLAEWQGLGYYRRAELLMDTAYAVAERGGELPATAAELAQLPGIGPYTAAAIASIAFGEAVAAVDGNIERVVTRLLALPGNPKQGRTRRAVVVAVESLMDASDPGSFNQALMDLGSVVCRPKRPRCEVCPLSEGCLALAEGDPERYPQLPERQRATDVTRLAAVVRQRGQVLMERRREPPNEGFFELPAVSVEATVIDARSSAPLFMRTADGPGPRLVRHMKTRYGLAAFIDRKLPPFKHAITRYRITVHPFVVSLQSGRVAEPLTWVSPTDPGRPMTTATRRILARTWPDEYAAVADGPLLDENAERAAPP